MQKYILSILPVLLSIVAPVTLCAQYTNTAITLIPAKDSAPKPVMSWKTPAKRMFPYTSYLLPASLMMYGFVSLHTDALQDVNESVKEEIYTDRATHKVHLDNYLQYAPGVAVYALNLVGIQGKNDFTDRTIIYGMSNLMLGITVTVVKKVTAEERPDGSDNLSFPSGHTATAFAAAEFMRQEYKDVSPLYGIAGYAAAFATGYLRMYNNKHWMGDVVAGAGVGIASTNLAYWIYPAIKRKIFKHKEVSTIMMPAYDNGAVGLVMVHHF